MDQGVIRSLKAKYQTKVIQKMIDAIDNDKTLPTISIIEAMQTLILTWNDVSTKAVQNCLRKAVFSDEDKDGDSNDPFFTFKHSIEQLQS